MFLKHGDKTGGTFYFFIRKLTETEKTQKTKYIFLGGQQELLKMFTIINSDILLIIFIYYIIRSFLLNCFIKLFQEEE
jgi:hypothetical protein